MPRTRRGEDYAKHSAGCGDDGVRVMEGGTHTELVKCRGMYAEIFTAQSTAYVAMYK